MQPNFRPEGVQKTVDRYSYELITSVYLSSESDPEPAVASKKQAQQRQDRFVFAYQDVA